MASHFSSIGFRIESAAEFEQLAGRAAAQGSIVPVSVGGSYAFLSTAEGVELWSQRAPDGSVIGCNPHFAGGSRYAGAFEIRVGRLIEGTGSPLDGRLTGTMADEEACGCPIVVDLPDFRCQGAHLAAGARAKVQIAAFASEIRLFDDEPSFFQGQGLLFPASGGAGMAAESFIPSGTFRPGGETIDPPEARAVLCGRILSARLLTNALTGLLFHALVVKTLGGVMDVVADPGLVSTPPKEGGVLFGSFWLSGRVLSPLSPPPLPPQVLEQSAPQLAGPMTPAQRDAIRRAVLQWTRTEEFDAYFREMHVPAGLFCLALLASCFMPRRITPSALIDSARQRRFATASLKRKYQELAERGQVVTAFNWMASTALTSGHVSCAPALLVAGADGSGEEEAFVRGIVEKLAAGDFRPASTEDVQAIRAQLRDEDYRAFRVRRLPRGFTGNRPVHLFDTMLHRSATEGFSATTEPAVVCLIDPERKPAILPLPAALVARART